MDTLITVKIFNSSLDAAVARDYLEQAGVQAYLSDEHMVSAYSMLNSALGGVKLQVSSADANRARELLQEIEAARETSVDQTPIRFACSECTKPLEFPGKRRGGVETCRHCGAYVDVPETDADTAPSIASTDSPESSPAAPPHTEVYRAKWPLHVEVMAVLSFTYVPLLSYALMGGSSAGGPSNAFSYVYFYQLFLASWQIICPLFLILSLIGEPLDRFGLTKPKWLVHSSQGLLLAVFLVVLSNQFVQVMTQWQVADYSQYAETYADDYAESYASQVASKWNLPTLVWCLAAFLANSVCEELLMRGYLITRLTQLWGKPAWAVLVSALLFGSYHIYQGWPNACWIAAEGVIFGMVFLKTKSLWPLIIGHTLVNLYGLTSY